MLEDLVVKQQCITYILRRNKRSRNVRLTIYPGGSIVVSAPLWITTNIVEKFIEEKTQWILKKVARLTPMKIGHVSRRSSYTRYREQARRFINERLEGWNTLYGFVYYRVAVKNHQSLWGSCSSNANLNFNYRILFLPIELADYVIVHEVCHLQEHNHSVAFWALVSRALPHYRDLRKRLKQYLAKEIPIHSD